MSVRPTDMQQIFSKESLVEKVQQSLDKQHQQKIAQGIHVDTSLQKPNKLSKDEPVHLKKKSEEKQKKHSSKNKKDQKTQEEDDIDKDKKEGSIIDIRV